MKHIIYRVSSPVAFLFLFLSCQFEPNGENYVEIEQEIKSWLEEYELSEIPEDIVILYPIQVNYSFTVGNGQFYLIEVTLGDRGLFASDLATGAFGIRPVVPPNQYGTLELVVSVYTSTATNSLADQVRAEAAVYQLKKNLMFDNRPAEANPFGIIETDTALVLKLERYQNENLHSNTIYVSADPDRLFDQENKVAVLNREQSLYIDQAYVGGTLFYGVETKVYSTSQQDIKRSTPFKVKSNPVPTVNKSVSLTDGTLKIHWSKAAFESSFKSYEVKWWLENEYQAHKFHFNNINDTSYVLEHLPLGDSVNVSIETINALDKGISNRSRVLLGNPDIEFGRLFVDPQNTDHRLTYDKSKSLLELVGSNKRIDITFDDIYFSKSNNLIAAYNTSAITLLDYSSLNTVKTINPKDFFSNPYDFPLRNLIIPDTRHLIYTNPATKIIDFKSKTEVNSFYNMAGINYFQRSGDIAFTHRDPSGAQNTFVVDMYKFQNDTLEFQNHRYHFFGFNGSFNLGDESLLLVADGSYHILSIPSLTVVANHALAAGQYVYGIDSKMNWALIWRDIDDVVTIGILELMTGEILYEFPYTSDGIEHYYLSEGVLYRGNGYSLRLQ